MVDPVKGPLKQNLLTQTLTDCVCTSILNFSEKRNEVLVRDSFSAILLRINLPRTSFPLNHEQIYEHCSEWKVETCNI